VTFIGLDPAQQGSQGVTWFSFRKTLPYFPGFWWKKSGKPQVLGGKRWQKIHDTHGIL